MKCEIVVKIFLTTYFLLQKILLMVAKIQAHYFLPKTLRTKNLQFYIRFFEVF